MDIFIAVLMTFAATALLAWLYLRAELKQIREKGEKQMKASMQRALQEQSESQLVLSAIDIGIVFYGADDQLSISNPAARNRFPVLPRNFHDFLDRYGEENGMRAQLVLGKEQVEAFFHDGHRVDHLLLQEIKNPAAALSGHIVLIRDVSRQFLEEQQRKKFVSNVSHELRTPLTTIKTYSESLIDWGISEKRPEQLKKDVNRIYEDSLRMEKLIDDLLLLAKVDESSIYFSMRVEPLDFVWLVRQVTERMQPQAEARQIRMSCTAVAQIPRIYADRSQMERVVENLISNAIKYGREKGEIKIYIGFLLDDVYIKVQDDGLGIDEADQDHIFDRFYRADISGSRQLGGTGLGLAIVKELVELHRGSISVQSALAQGSEFTVMIPCANKILRLALYELSHEGRCSGGMMAAAAKDLQQLAEGLGIVAQWQSLQNAAYKALLTRIDEETQVSGSRSPASVSERTSGKETKTPGKRRGERSS